MYRVYLLDDEVWLLDSLEEIINWTNYNAVIVGKQTSSTKALEDIIRLDPDIVFTDIRMPDMNGIELMQKIKMCKKDIAFILVTGYSEFEYAKQAILLNAVDYCLKPIEEDTIIKALLKAQKACDNKKLLSALENKENKSNESSSKTYKMVKDYIHENFKDNITLNEIADFFHYNPAYISMLIKKESGKNFITYLNELKINYACELLDKTDLSINEISNMCGFENYFYFARLFKKIKNVTPTEYKRDVI